MPEDNNQISQVEMDALVDELNQLFTPILVANELTAGIADRIEGNSGTVIKFDADTRKAQLISVCARLVAKFQSAADYEQYVAAATAAKALKLKMQKDNHAAAVALADEYLHRMAHGSDNSDVVKAATALSAVKVTLG